MHSKWGKQDRVDGESLVFGIVREWVSAYGYG